MATSDAPFAGGYIITQPNALSVTAEATLYAPATGNRFRLTGFILGTSAAGVLLIKDGTGGTTILTIPFTTSQTLVIDLGQGLVSATANNLLRVILSVAGTISGTIWGKDEVPD